ncbi:type I-F CRISPR-associated protein Csy2 [Alkalimonas mucilaginosa]|uniref:Type I-F CRISPR-associated protein Csy2 n=1 Tax=Alkalimonas mucilaginosa TaxID=3057676 RepID=A0ABU7JIJ3_9GAMM|nr:type I-F CRISPR-associated protein Csy2 [Alkalimonas sp. MEB004]MEE2025485.1 type I-F CRISPR-associated protein Csy2 [Alkalimonas sp. MEB004]
MSNYFLLEHLKVQNANCIAGLTYGFPAITHFLGYTHALSRKLQQQFGIELTGCAVVCHQHQVQAYQPSGWGDYVFALTRNPLTKEGNTAPIVEEGRMHLTVSLILEADKAFSNSQQQRLVEMLGLLAQRQKLAGGQVISLKGVSLYSDDDEQALSRKLLRKMLPGFVLTDRSELLKQHYQQLVATQPNATMLDAWLDFSALTYRAVIADDVDSSTDQHAAEWVRVPKPANGYLVPITTGYKAISPLYPAGAVANSRDPQYPFCFVESAYGVGLWLSPHRVPDVRDVIWRYRQQGPWYLCATNTSQNALKLHPEQEAALAELPETELTYY